MCILLSICISTSFVNWMIFFCAGSWPPLEPVLFQLKQVSLRLTDNYLVIFLTFLLPFPFFFSFLLVMMSSVMTPAVRNRMKSVKNIQKITKAMKMVAASKLRAIQVKAENSRGLWQPFTALLGDSSSMFTFYQKQLQQNVCQSLCICILQVLFDLSD